MNKISLNLFLFLILISGNMQSQDQLPFKSIPEYPDNYKSGNIILRMIQELKIFSLFQKISTINKQLQVWKEHITPTLTYIK